MASAHPESATLGAYAAGTLSDGMSLLVAAHMTYCPTCRRKVAAMEQVGGATLAQAAPVSMGHGALDSVFGLIDQPVPLVVTEQAPANPNDGILPRVLHDVVGASLEELDWSFRIPGLHEYTMSGFEQETVSLLRARPGTQMLAHTHKGDEATLILQGAMQDGDHVYRAGDVAQADHSHDHRPSIVGDETCYCLIVMEGGMQFTGRFGRALNILSR